MAKHKVRTTMRPDVEIEVEGPELLDLQRQGLLVADAVKPPADPPVEPVSTQKGAK